MVYGYIHTYSCFLSRLVYLSCVIFNIYVLGSIFGYFQWFRGMICLQKGWIKYFVFTQHSCVTSPSGLAPTPIPPYKTRALQNTLRRLTLSLCKIHTFCLAHLLLPPCLYPILHAWHSKWPLTIDKNTRVHIYTLQGVYVVDTCLFFDCKEFKYLQVSVQKFDTHHHGIIGVFGWYAGCNALFPRRRCRN